MKNFYSLLLLLSLFTVLFAGSCKKEKPCADPICKLPPITQEGKNTFGCLVDGQPWTANTSDAFLTAPPLRAIYASYRLINGKYFFNLSTKRRNAKEGIASNIDLFIQEANAPGEYFLNSNAAVGFPNTTTVNNSVGIFTISDPFAFPYQTDSIHSGKVTITKYDINNKIASGTFYFTAKNINNDSLVQITEGRFDVKLP
ncbi:MAG: hypothetical protein JWQ96_1351 [Segetibacter sp.]|nr:hypothetical protein [Segetibacter sp.]